MTKFQYMKYLVLPALTLALFSCGNNTTPEQTHPAAQATDTIPVNNDDSDTDEEVPEMPVATEIGSIQPGELVLDGQLVTDSVIHKCFPGTYAEVPADYGTYHGSWWLCSNCKRQELFYNYFIEPDPQGWFPDSTLNITLGMDPDSVELPGKTLRLINFFHINEAEMDFTGRFAGVPTGAALFRQEGKRFVLESFAPVLGTFGSFHTPVSPIIHIAGKRHILLEYTYTNGGAGSEFTAITELFMPAGKKINKVLSDRFIFCTNTQMGEWSSVIHPADSLAEGNPADLVIVTTGWVDGKFIDESDDEDDLHYFDTASAELKNRAAQAKNTKEKFNFRLTRIFAYNGTRYTIKESKTEFL